VSETPSLAGIRIYLVEHYSEGVDEATALALATRLAAAAEARRDDVRLIGSACVPSDESFLSLFSSSSPDGVVGAVESAGVVVDRIVPVLWIGVEDCWEQR
jgi:hypothetical protein